MGVKKKSISLKRNKTPQLEKVSVLNMTDQSARTVLMLAEKATQFRVHDLTEMGMDMKLSVTILAERKSIILAKCASKFEQGPFVWTMPRSLLTAIYWLLRNTDFVPEWRATMALQIIYPYVR
jgi:hypothetical protein